MIRTILMVTVFLLLGIPAGLIGIPYTLLTGDIRWMYRAGARTAHLGLKAAGIRFDVKGEQNIPDGRACLFLANHVSNLDPPALVPAIPGTPSVMLKSELMRIPILGPAMRMARFVPVDRGAGREAAVTSAKLAAEALQSGLHMLVFAEGTRSRTGRLLPFKPGPFHLAQKTGVPIVPVAIYGTETMLQKGSFAVQPGTAHIQFLPPVEAAQFRTRAELIEAVHSAIASALPEHMQPERREA